MRRVGATAVGPIVGVSAWRNAADVYWDLVHGIVPRRTKIQARGLEQEEAVREEYRRAVGPCTDAPCTREAPLLHPDWSYASATPDGFCGSGGSGDRGLLELKTVSRWSASKWGRAGTDEVPPTYLCQVAWGMAVAQCQWAHLLAAFGDDAPERGWATAEYRLYTFRRDAALEEMLRLAVEKFWVGHIIGRVPPSMPPLGAIKRQIAALTKGEKSAI